MIAGEVESGATTVPAEITSTSVGKMMEGDRRDMELMRDSANY